MEKLTIQHIAAFGDKKLKALKNVTGENKIVTIEGYVKGEGGEYLFFKGDDGSVGNYYPEYFKPYMHHISCLTKTIQHEGTEFCPLIELAKIAGLSGDWRIEDDMLMTPDGDYFYLSNSLSWLLGRNITRFAVKNQYQLFQKLAEWHIDFLGLIEKGLAIDKNTLK